MKFNLLRTFDTTYCADSVEWCPFPPYQQYFVCGTYELQTSSQPLEEKSDQVRLGQLHLFSVNEKLELQLHDTADSGGILDIKWCPHSLKFEKILATANADGRIIVWKFQNVGERKTITLISTLQINNSNVLSLSLDWSASDCGSLCVSDSTGYVSILQLNDQMELTVTQKLKVHDYEAWIVTFDYKNSSLLMSGGDDCLLRITDTNTGKKVKQLDEHKSGVTAIKFNHLNPDVFASGSYDETIKIWDSRNLSRTLSSLEVGGGIWRIKWDPQKAENILIAGMYAGIFLIRYLNADAQLQALSRFEQHESIAYGADYCYFSSNELKNYFFGTKATNMTTTCSFYDKKLCLSFLQ